MTTASAASLSASLAPDGSRQHTPATNGTAFAQVFAGFDALWTGSVAIEAGLAGGGVPRQPANSVEPQKQNKADSAVVTAAVAFAAAPLVIPIDLHLGLPAAGNTTALPITDIPAAPQQPGAIPAQKLPVTQSGIPPLTTQDAEATPDDSLLTAPDPARIDTAGIGQTVKANIQQASQSGTELALPPTDTLSIKTSTPSDTPDPATADTATPAVPETQSLPSPGTATAAYAQGSGAASALWVSTTAQAPALPGRVLSRDTSGLEKQPLFNAPQPAAGASLSTSAAATTPVLPASPVLESGVSDSYSAWPADSSGGAPQPLNAAPAQMPAAAADPKATAFTMRLQVATPADSAASSPASAAQPQASAPASAPAIKEALQADTQPESHSPEQLRSQPTLLAAFEQHAQVSVAGAPRQTPAVSRASQVQTAELPEQPKAVSPLNRLVLQVGPSANDKVTVRVVQNSGELRMAVHTDNSDLAHGLQQGLSDLVGKLQDSGYKAESWQPVQTPAGAPAAAESHSASNHTPGGDTQSHTGGSQQDGGQRHQNQSSRPRWVEELESSFNTGGQPLGESYGYSR